MPKSNSFPTCASCIFFDSSYKGEGDNYGLCRHKNKVWHEYANGVPVAVHPVFAKSEKSCAYYSGEAQIALSLSPSDRLVGQMLGSIESDRRKVREKGGVDYLD